MQCPLRNLSSSLRILWSNVVAYLQFLILGLLLHMIGTLISLKSYLIFAFASFVVMIEHSIFRIPKKIAHHSTAQAF